MGWVPAFSRLSPGIPLFARPPDLTCMSGGRVAFRHRSFPAPPLLGGCRAAEADLQACGYDFVDPRNKETPAGLPWRILAGVNHFLSKFRAAFYRGTQCCASCLWRTASKSSMAALTETLRESRRPSMGMRMCASAASRQTSVRPVDSVPITMAVPCRMGVS